MNKRKSVTETTLTALGLATAAGVVLLAFPSAAKGGDGAEELPESVDLTGVVRDFRERSEPNGHPDFERRPDSGFGHYTGNVWLTLDPNGKPLFTGGGRKIQNQATSDAGNPIAPNMANQGYFCGAEDGLPDQWCVTLEDSNGVENFEICFISAVFNPDGTSSWTYNVRELGEGQDLSHWNLALDPSQEVMSGTTPGYEVGTDGSTGIYGIKWDVQDGFEQGEFTIVLDQHYQGVEQNEGVVVVAKAGPSYDASGLFRPGEQVSETGYPYDLSGVVDPEPMGDSPASYGSADSGGVDSATSFRQWFRDVPGVNASKTLEITLQREEGSEVFVFDDTEDPEYADLGGFFPINGELFGNSEGEDKNFHFTFELNTEFVYEEGAGHVFTFTGDDDVWVFIDDKLVIDLGGVHSATSQTIELDRLECLEDGETYSLDFFFAERHRTQSNFRIETTLHLQNGELPSVSAMYD